MSNKQVSAKQFGVYATAGRYAKNRERKLTRLLSKNPNNSEQLALAVSNLRYKRKAPKIRVWSKSKIKEVMDVRPLLSKPIPAAFDQRTAFTLGSIARWV